MDEYEPPVQDFEIYVSPWTVVGWAVLGIGATAGILGLLHLGARR